MATRRTASTALLRLLLVDDHPMWRQTLVQVVAHTGVATVVGEAADGDQAVELARSTSPDVVLMDMELPGRHGVEATRAIVAEQPHVRVLVLSSSDDEAQVVQAMRAGARGYLLKTVRPEELADAVRRVAAGEVVLPPALSDVVLAELRTPTLPEPGPATRVVVSARHALDREGLARLLRAAGLEVAGRPVPPERLPGLVQAEAPEVVVLDATGSAGLDAVAALRRADPAVRVLVLADDAATVAPLLDEEAAAAGLLLKSSVDDLRQLADAVRRVAAGEVVVDGRVVALMLAGRRAVRSRPVDDLTPRERDVLALMAEGRSNQAIGEQLFVGAKTVEAHVASIFVKLGLESTRSDHRRVLAVLAWLEAGS